MSYTTEFIFSAIVSCVIIFAITGFSSFHNRNFQFGVTGYVLCLLIILAEHFLEYSGYFCDFPFIIYSSTLCYFAMAPLLNVVIVTLFKQSIRWKRFWLEMIVPAGALIWMIPFYLLPGEQKCQYVLNYVRHESCDCGMAPRHIALIVILLIQTAIYSVFWLKTIRRYSKEVKSRTSASSVEFVPWISRVLGSIILFGFSIIAAGLTRVFARENFYAIDQVENIVFSFIPHIFLILLFFLHEKPLPQLTMLTSAETDETFKIKAELVQKLQEVMQKEELYLDPDLSLADVATRMALTRNHLSALLSKGLRKKFYDFVNEYRVEHAKRLMSSDMIHAFSLSGIARESGFNSYVSFYRVFKRVVGVSPSNFIKNQ